METPLMSEIDKSLMLDGIKNGSDIKRECEFLRCKSYIGLLEDRIRHLDFITMYHNMIIESLERQLSMPNNPLLKTVLNIIEK